jgi:phospholipase C
MSRATQVLLAGRFFRCVTLLGLAFSFGCGSSSGNGQTTTDAGRESTISEAGNDAASPGEAGNTDAAPTCPTESPTTDSPTGSNIKHVIVVVQENHSFDNYFSYYCTAATGSRPTCNTGPACCETGPALEPGGADATVGPLTQDDTANGNYDPNHAQACELEEIDDGKMDMYVTATPVGTCGSPHNFAYANETTIKPYWDLAQTNALADNYFQSVAGASSSNDMYLAIANYVFADDDYEPKSIGAACQGFGTGGTMSFTGTTIGDLLVNAKVPWAWYAQGYADMIAAQKVGKCPTDPACTAGKNITFYPCTYCPGDVPFEYYPQFTDNPKYMVDYTKLACDVSAGVLPAVSYVKGLGFRTEHPGLGDTISNGETFVTEVIDTLTGTKYAKDTLILITWDESGGFFDHIPPPPNSTVDHQPYGPRIPLLAVGPFAKKNYISHVQMEHSSIVKFIEWNWLGKTTGQLGHRDAVVNNIGDMLDPTQTGTEVPAN